MTKNLKRMVSLGLVSMTLMFSSGCSFWGNNFRSDKNSCDESAFDCVLENRSTIGEYENACYCASMQILLRACLEKEGLLKEDETIFERYAQQCIDVANRKHSYKKSIEEFEEIFSRPCLSAPKPMPNTAKINKEQAFLAYIADSLDVEKYDKQIFYGGNDEKKSEVVNTVLEAVNLKKKLYTCYVLGQGLYYNDINVVLSNRELGKALIRHSVKKGLPVAASSFENYNEKTGEITYHCVTQDNYKYYIDSEANPYNKEAIEHTKVINGFNENKNSVYVNESRRKWWWKYKVDKETLDYLDFQYIYYFIDDEFLERNTPIWIPSGKDELHTGDKVYLAINNAVYNQEKNNLDFQNFKIDGYDGLNIRLCDGKNLDKTLVFEDVLKCNDVLEHRVEFFIYEITIPKEYDGIKTQDLIDKKLIRQS